MSVISFVNAEVEKLLYLSPLATPYLKLRYPNAWKLKDAFANFKGCDYAPARRQALADILNYADRHVPYYHALMPAGEITPDNADAVLQKLPTLTKSIIRREKDRIYSDQLKQCCSYWNNTGGSTGEPLRFPVSHNTGFENELALYMLMGWQLHDRIISLDGTTIPRHEIEKGHYYTLKPGANELPYGKIRFSSLFFEGKYLSQLFRQLDSFAPHFLRGYSSAFIILAHYMLKTGIRLTQPLKGLYFTSEICPEEELPKIREAFQCPVFGQYGNSECTQYGLAQDGKTYLCSPTHGYVEVLDRDGKHVREGECGEIVSTGLHNRAMPFIRYHTGDLAEYGGEINGFVILRSLLGRTIDYIINARQERIYLVGFIFGRHLHAFNHLAGWQLEQAEPGNLVMRIVRGEGFDTSDEKELIAHFASVQTNVEIHYVEQIPRTPRGKQKFIIQHC